MIARRLVAILLPLLLAFSPFAAFAANSLGAAMSCCRHKNKCCCKKGSTAGPAISARSCADGCAQSPATSGTPLAAANAKASQSGHNSTVDQTLAIADHTPPTLAPTDFHLHQRPPPSLA